MGYYLSRLGLRFVLLEASAAIGQVWRDRYDSLTLFTPSQYNNLPGMPFPKARDLYPTKDEVADYLEAYAACFELPVRCDAPVSRLTRTPEGYRVEAGSEVFEAPQVVVATGAFQRPYVPPLGASLSPEVFQLHSVNYRNPEQIPPGDVLVVGAGNSGAQIAEELSASRKVYLSIGRRDRYLPRRFLGRGIFWWLDVLGFFEVSRDTLIGKWLRRRDVQFYTDIPRLVRENGLDLLGRTTSVAQGEISFADGRRLSVKNIVWATGFQPDYGWLELPIFDERGRPHHQRGVTSAEGLYFLGLPWQYRRSSALIGGVGRDAEFLAQRIAERLGLAAQKVSR
ncbi:putative oxidoreductase CzcO [compost metagenome]